MSFAGKFFRLPEFGKEKCGAVLRRARWRGGGAVAGAARWQLVRTCGAAVRQWRHGAERTEGGARDGGEERPRHCEAGEGEVFEERFKAVEPVGRRSGVVAPRCCGGVAHGGRREIEEERGKQ